MKRALTACLLGWLRESRDTITIYHVIYDVVRVTAKRKFSALQTSLKVAWRIDAHPSCGERKLTPPRPLEHPSPNLRYTGPLQRQMVFQTCLAHRWEEEVTSTQPGGGHTAWVKTFITDWHTESPKLKVDWPLRHLAFFLPVLTLVQLEGHVHTGLISSSLKAQVEGISIDETSLQWSMETHRSCS